MDEEFYRGMAMFQRLVKKLEEDAARTAEFRAGLRIPMPHNCKLDEEADVEFLPGRNNADR